MRDKEKTICARSRLRQLKLMERDSLSKTFRAESSRRIRDEILQLDSVRKAKHVMIYVNFRSEVETFPLFSAFHKVNIMTSAPRTVARDQRLIACLINNPAEDLRPGYRRIPEPGAEHALPINPAEVDVVLVPGLVFDAYGGRLGYGGGYYDRFLADEAPLAQRVGLAFETQVIRQVPILGHDVRMHCLVTETGIIRRFNG